MQKLRNYIYMALEGASHKSRLFLIVDIPIILLILANVVAAALETVPHIQQQWGDELHLFEQISLAVFVVEYLLRLWVCLENPGLNRLGPWRGRLRFALTPYALIDLLVILPSLLTFILPGLDLRFLRLIRILRLLKLARYSPALATLGRVIVEERRALYATLMIMAVLLLFSSTAMYYAERHVQPDVLGTIPDAMWWALATLTTVGYGDVTPVTAIGKLIGGLVMIFGLGVFALPIGILASGFNNEIHRQHFVISWSMVADLPLFRHLDADQLAWVSSRLQARDIPAHTILFHEGDEADAMYFLRSGHVTFEYGEQSKEVAAGQHFGELGLFFNSPHMATARTRTRCKLLMMESGDFHELIRKYPSVSEAIEATANKRLVEMTNQ